MMEQPLTWYVNLLQGVIFLFVIASALYGFWRGKLPYWIGSLVRWRTPDGDPVTLSDASEKINSMHATVECLDEKYDEMADDIRGLKIAQVDIAEAVNNGDKHVPVDALEEMHFGNDDAPMRGDFISSEYDKWRDERADSRD